MKHSASVALTVWLISHAWAFNQAFMQTDGELRYLVDGGALKVSENIQDEHVISDDTSLSGSSSGDPTVGGTGGVGVSVLGVPISFEPRELDFGDQPLGLPVLRKVRVHNLNAQSSIQMLSISGNTIHFHCSFFTDKVIPPLGNTTFDVVLLGREEGAVENTLYVHTSAGSFRFVVRARATPSAFRLQPLVGVRMPVNSSYSPTIHMHNPHSQPMQVLEMYSSGGDLHLELPGGETDGPQDLWQIQPFHTKPVMKANFVARTESNHTAYIRIKTNTTGAEFLYVPLEVEVSSAPGLYCPQELLDFGLLWSGGAERRTVRLLLLNSAPKAVALSSVTLAAANDAVTIDFTPGVKVPQDTIRPTTIAEITFDPSLVATEGVHTGKILVKSRTGQFKVAVPYRAHVLLGAVKPADDDEATRFHVADDQRQAAGAATTRDVSITNSMASAVVVHKLNVGAEALKFFHFQQKDSSSSSSLTSSSSADPFWWFSPVILAPGETRTLFSVRLRPTVWDVAEAERCVQAQIIASTNVSDVRVPIVSFHGKLRTFLAGSPSQDVLDYGTLGMGEKRDLFFAVINANPVTLAVRRWGSNLTGSLVEMLGVGKGHEAAIMHRHNFSADGLERRLSIPPGHYMLFRVGILTPSDGDEGDADGAVFVDSDHDAFEVRFRFTVAKGSIHTVPRELVFESAFPGTRSELKLRVFSSFLQAMATESVTAVPPDARFSFEPVPSSVLQSGEKSLIGKVVFDPEAACRQTDACYAGFNTNTKFGREWLRGTTLYSGCADSDLGVLHTLHNRLVKTSSAATFNITLRLDTDQVRGFLFKARASLVWPKVASPAEAAEAGSAVRFPLTQVGNATFRDVLVSNPTTQDLLVHVVLLDAYPNGLKVVNMVPNRPRELGDLVALNHTVCSHENAAACTAHTFSITSVLDASKGHASGSAFKSFGHDVETHADTKAFVLPPGRTAKVRLRFKPPVDAEAANFYTALFARNNLTGIEVVDITAQSVFGSLQFGLWRSSDPPAEVDPILKFEVKEKHLKGCDYDPSRSLRYSLPILTVKRSFKLKNSGQTPIFIGGFDVEGVPCVGYGFKVLNCGSDSPSTPQPPPSTSAEAATAFSSLSAFSGLVLLPNEQREIEIAFTPDFTLAVVQRRLSVRTSLSPDRLRSINFTLEATVPPNMLARCSAVLPRWSIESYLYYGLNAMMLFLVACVVAAAYFESDRILKCTVVLPVLQRATVEQTAFEGAVFDLRGIRDQVNQELRQRQPVQNTSGVRGRRGPPPLSGPSASAAASASPSPSEAAGTANAPQSMSLLERTSALLLWPLRLASKASGVAYKLAWDSVNHSVSKEDKDSGTGQEDSPSPSGSSSGGESSRSSSKTPQQQPQLSSAQPLSRKAIKKQQQQRQQQIRRAVCKTLSGQSLDDLETASTTTESSSFSADADEGEGKPVGTADLATHDNNNKKSKKQKKQATAKSTVAKSILGNEVAETPTMAKVKPTVKITSEAQAAKSEVKSSSDKKQAKLSADVKPSASSGTQKKVGSGGNGVATMAKSGESESPIQVPLQLQRSNSCESPSAKNTTNSSNQNGDIVSVLTPQKQKAKITPVGKILPEPKNLGAQFGPVGTKPAPPCAPPTSALPLTSISSLGPSTSASSMSSPGSGRLFNTWLDSATSNEQSFFGQLGTEAGPPPPLNTMSLLEPTPSLYPSTSSPQRSLMQALQAERRQKTEEYLRKQTDWPGFDVSPCGDYLSQLWDNPHEQQQQQQQQMQQQQLQTTWPAATWGISANLSGVLGLGLGANTTSAETANTNNVASIWDVPEKGKQQQPAQQQQQPTHSWSSTLFKD